MATITTPTLGSGAYIFDGPDFRYRKIALVYPGEILEVLSVQSPWLQIMYHGIKGWIPSVSVDYTDTTTRKLNYRFNLLWPTDYRIITQQFNRNPEFYAKFGLPGHEGLDFKAPDLSYIYSCAEGQVFLIHDGSNNHPYGIHIRIQHRDGFQTIYAHLSETKVKLNEEVKPRQIIGLADSTGNSTGPHLHLTLKKKGATAAGLTIFPNDIIDPTPYLVF